MSKRDKSKPKKSPAEQGKPKHPAKGRARAKRTEARKRAKE